MAQFRGNLSGTLHDSAEARDKYERHALTHAWGAAEKYREMDPEKRKRIDDELDAIVAESMGTPVMDEFVARHPAAENEDNARAVQRYFNARGIKPPYRLFELEQAWEELKNDGALVFSSGQEAANEWKVSQRRQE